MGCAPNRNLIQPKSQFKEAKIADARVCHRLLVLIQDSRVMQRDNDDSGQLPGKKGMKEGEM